MGDDETEALYSGCSARASLATSTMFLRLFSVSAQARVLRPQSGLTQMLQEGGRGQLGRLGRDVDDDNKAESD